MLVPARDLRVGLHRPRTLEDAGQAVVVGGGDRVELVVVTPRTSQRQPQERPAHGIDLLIHEVHLHLRRVGLRQHLRPQRQEPGRDQLLVTRRFAGRGQQIARELLDEEAVERLVAVEGGHDIIAIAPGIPVSDVLVETVGIRVPRHVEPVSAPALAIGRRREQAIDEPRVGVRSLVRQEGMDLIHRGRQPGQIEGDSSDQGPLVGPRGGSQTRRLEFRQDKAIDRSSRPRLVFDARDSLVDGSTKRPMVRVAAPRATHGGGRRERNAHLDPSGQVGDLALGKFILLGRHFPYTGGMSHGTDQERLCGLARNDRRAGIASLEQRFARVEP